MCVCLHVWACACVCVSEGVGLVGSSSNKVLSKWIDNTNHSLHENEHKGLSSDLLTLFTLASVRIFSILFSIHFLRC